MKKKIALFLCAALAVLLGGCRVHVPLGLGGYITGEEYPDAEKYRTGAFSYSADEISAVEVYWRCGEVEIVESDGAELAVRESGSELPEGSAMHFLLDGEVLRTRFCASGAKIQVNEADKHLRLEVPKGISLSVHTTSAPVRADALEQKDILIAAHSGCTRLGAVTAGRVDLSSSSGSIQAESVSAQTLVCSALSGAVGLGEAAAQTIECSTSSGFVRMDGVDADSVGVTTSSGGVELTLADVPEADVSTSSGDVTLTLGEGGAELLYASKSGKMQTELAWERKGDLYVFGAGEGRLTVETASGRLKIR